MTRNLLLAAFALTLFYSVAQATISGGSSGGGATVTGTPGDIPNFSGSGALQDSGTSLGSAALQPSSAFDATGAAASAKSYFTSLTGYVNCNGSGTCTAATTVPESALGTIATSTLLGNTSGSTAAPTAVAITSTTGDLNITSGGVVTVTGIQGNSVSGVTGTGAVVLANNPTFTNVTLPSGSTLTDVINQDHSANTVSTTVFTSNTTLGQVTGLQATLTAGGTYDCMGHLSLTADSAGGVKAAVGGTVGVTGMSFTFTNWNGATVNAKGTVTALNTAAAGATAVATDVDIQGAIVVNTAGTFYPMAAENASDATSTTINKYSYFACQRIN